MNSDTLLIIIFSAVVVILLVIDLGIFNKNAHTVTNKEAIIWSCVWIALALLFSIVVYSMFGVEKWSEYMTAYWVEKSLSVDNLFIFILIFTFFNVKSQYQHKVLYLGIVGAIILRGIFIFTGAEIINATYLPDFDFLNLHFHEFNIILTLFGAFLIYAGIKAVSEENDKERDFSNSFGIKIVKAIFPVTEKYVDGKFFTKINGKRHATLLLLVVGVIEITDLLFAVDSIPAIFTISTDPFILYTSNIFAILGLRALYFVLNNFIRYFAYLKYGLAIILAFIGFKMVLDPIFQVSSLISLIFVVCVLIITSLTSIIWKAPVVPAHKRKK